MNILRFSRILPMVSLLSRLTLAGIFLWAGLVKAGASEQLSLTIATIGLVPSSWIQPVAWFLPWVELLAAILILIPKTVKFGAVLIFGLCLTFASVILYALSQGLIVDCSCFGESTPSMSKMIFTVIRDATFAGLATFVYILELKKPHTKGI